MLYDPSAGWDQRARLLGKLNPQLLHRLYHFPLTAPKGFALPESGQYLVMLFSLKEGNLAVIPAALYGWDGEQRELPKHGLRPTSRPDLPFPYEVTPLRHLRSQGDMLNLAEQWAHSTPNQVPRQRY